MSEARGHRSTDVETAAYFTACEGLTNAVKHARANRVSVRLAHAAYGAGVWAGCLWARSATALLPRFSGPVEPPHAP